MKKILIFNVLLYLINIILIYKLNISVNFIVTFIIITFIYLLLSIFILKAFKDTVLNINMIFYIFTFIIFAQGVILFNFNNSISAKENRNLASFPDVNPFHEGFAEQMDSYINDRIGLRNNATDLFRKLNFFNDFNIMSRVLIGVDNWLFFNTENDDFKYFTRSKSFTDEKLEKVKEVMNKNIEFCKKHGIELITLIAPNKSTIYPELYNPYFNKLKGVDNYIILKNYIEKNINTSVIMPYDELMNGKDKLLYYPLDTHWTSNGAYIAYQVLEEKIIEKFPYYKRLNKNDIKECQQNQSNDLEVMLNIKFDRKPIQSICTVENNLLIVKRTDPPQLNSVKSYGGEKAPKILLIHDSFMHALSPFIEKGASHIGHLWIYDNDFSNYSEQILQFKPDIIIWEKIERSMFMQ